MDAQLKSRISEQKTARARVSYKNVEEVDREIQRLEKQVDAGTMKLVDEKKALAEISSLRKQRKGFAGFEEAQKGIDDVKAQISELRKSLDNPEAKALSDKYTEITKELDDIKAEQDEAYKSLSSLRDERTKLHSEQQEKYAAMRDIKDQFHKARLAYRDYEQEQWRQRQERQKAERDAYQKEKRRKIADKKLEEASEPAYMDEILTAEGLIRYFDPSAPAASKTLRGPSGFAAEAQRTIDDSAMKGTKVSKKDEREDTYFMGTGGKKGKKSRKANGTSSPAPLTPTEGKFNLSIGVIEELAKVNVEPPMNQSGVPLVIDKLKEKLDHWKKDQDAKTKEVSFFFFSSPSCLFPLIPTLTFMGASPQTPTLATLDFSYLFFPLLLLSSPVITSSKFDFHGGKPPSPLARCARSSYLFSLFLCSSPSIIFYLSHLLSSPTFMSIPLTPILPLEYIQSPT